VAPAAVYLPQSPLQLIFLYDINKVNYRPRASAFARSSERCAVLEGLKISVVDVVRWKSIFSFSRVSSGFKRSESQRLIFLY
jgi:hypothetical protein